MKPGRGRIARPRVPGAFPLGRWRHRSLCALRQWWTSERAPGNLVARPAGSPRRPRAAVDAEARSLAARERAVGFLRGLAPCGSPGRRVVEAAIAAAQLGARSRLRQLARARRHEDLSAGRREAGLLFGEGVFPERLPRLAVRLGAPTARSGRERERDGGEGSTGSHGGRVKRAATAPSSRRRARSVRRGDRAHEKTSGWVAHGPPTPPTELPRREASDARRSPCTGPQGGWSRIRPRARRDTTSAGSEPARLQESRRAHVSPGL